MRRLLLVLPLVLLMATGCVRAHARTRPEPPALDMPPPPARVIVPVEPDEEPADETAVTEPAEKERRPTRPRPSTRSAERPETAKPADAKPDPPPAEAARPPVTPPVPMGSLQPKLPASPGEMERQVRDQLGQASRELQRVDYRLLSVDGKSQYDTAKRFIEQAGQALTEKNLVFASRLAEKALGLASNLVAR